MFHWTDGELAPLALPESLRLVTVISSLVDHLNRLWLSFENGAVIVVADGHPIETLTERGQVEPTVFRALFEDQKGAIWLGGNRGLARVSAGGVLSVPTASALPTDSVIGIVEDQMGDLWLALEGAGVARINRQEVALALSSPEHPVQFSYYDKSDGFAGAPRWFGDSSAARSNDGRLWFISRRGVTMIDPNQLPATRDVRPVVEIERVIADAVHMFPASSVSLPAGTARVEIDYTIPILSTPFRVRFRYRLDGFDDDWVEAGTRRQAVYTNLPPRDYVFRVMTNDGNGTWTDAEATMSFSILPRFYQESWFAVGCVSLLSLLAWGSWRLRLRRVRTQFALLFSERARLAREIHDTLLQGLFGIGLQCETIASELVPPDHELRGRLLSLQQEAEEYVREARSSIRDLRSPKLQSGDLVSALHTAGARLTAGTTLQYVFSVDGEPYRFSPTAEEQLLRVGEEALRNVVRHASAREVQVMLRYWRTSVTLRIVDDGCGFDYRRDSLRSDHCGLESMRERTHAVRGEFRVSSEIRRGTKIEVTVPRAQGQ
jgi:signal transduction histidine kinase